MDDSKFIIARAVYVSPALLSITRRICPSSSLSYHTLLSELLPQSTYPAATLLAATNESEGTR